MQKIYVGLCILILLILGNAPSAKALTPEPVIGMATGNTLLFISDEALEERFDDMKALGVAYVRIDFSWALIQRNGYNHWDYRYHDRVVDAANRHNIKVLGMLAYTPAWARNLKCVALLSTEEAQQKCTPRDMHEFARFTGNMAQRYSPRGVHAWEIWNEQNHKGFWKGVGASGTFEIIPEAYMRLANAAGAAIRTVDADAEVITGGLAPAFSPTDPNAMRPGDFVSRMLPVMQSGAITAIGMHPYTSPALPREHYDWNAFWTIDNGSDPYNLRRILDNAGKTDMLIWGTEFGASTVGQHDVANVPAEPRVAGKIYDHVTEDMQAIIMQQGIEDWYVKPKVGPLFIHAESDQWLRQSSNEGGYGLRRLDGTEKPAYSIFRDSFISIKITILGIEL